MIKKFVAVTATIASLLSAVSAITTPSRIMPADDGKFIYMELTHKHDSGSTNKGSHFYMPMQMAGSKGKSDWTDVKLIPTSNEQSLEVSTTLCTYACIEPQLNADTPQERLFITDN